MSHKLTLLRKKIDQIDDRLIKLLAQRMRVVEKIGEWKKQKGLPLLDKKRWREVLGSKVNKAKKLDLNPALVKKIYNLIHKFALEREGKLK
jgi:chorismate mutase